MNKVIVSGKLGQDPELRRTQSGTAVCNLSIATNEYGKDKDGNKTEHTEWHKCVTWSKLAENCAQYISKGRYVVVEGRLTTRQWEDKNGQKQFTTEIVANNVEFGPNTNPSTDFVDHKQAQSQTPAVNDLPF